jgi:hypothetical protein
MLSGGSSETLANKEGKEVDAPISSTADQDEVLSACLVCIRNADSEVRTSLAAKRNPAEFYHFRHDLWII